VARDEPRFDGRVVVVTGAGNGLGRDYALALAGLGAKVVVNDLGGDPDGRGASRIADEVVTLIRANGGEAVASYDSVATRAGGNAIVACALDSFGKIDALINNAGILRDRSFEKLTDDDIDGVIDTHLKGAFYVTQPAFREMKRAGYGRILFTASAAGMFGLQGMANYGAAKAATFGLMNVVALEGEPHGIRANALLPRGTSRLDHVAGGDIDLLPLLPEGAAALALSFAPSFVTPLALYLVSEQCAATHHVYSAFAGRYARCFVGLTRGWAHAGDGPPSLADVGARWAEIETADDFQEPLSVMDEFRIEIERRRSL
jgi:NAD(P)-dependent dehydrogenase (short-subunit alcohol dehydrogenase family)